MLTHSGYATPTGTHSLRLHNTNMHSLAQATLFTWLSILESTIQKEHFIKFSHTHCKYKSLPATEQLRRPFFTHFEALVCQQSGDFRITLLLKRVHMIFCSTTFTSQCIITEKLPTSQSVEQRGFLDMLVMQGYGHVLISRYQHGTDAGVLADDKTCAHTHTHKKTNWEFLFLSWHVLPWAELGIDKASWAKTHWQIILTKQIFLRPSFSVTFWRSPPSTEMFIQSIPGVLSEQQICLPKLQLSELEIPMEEHAQR